MSRERERFDEIGKKIKREVLVVHDHGTTCTSTSIMGLPSPPSAAPPPPGRLTGMISSRTHMLTGGGSSGSGSGGAVLNTITPCAACKLLRRRCAQECPFSPYFSPHEPQKFASVHKVFGASNVSKMLLEVAETQRADAANSLVYEANVRLRDPVYGCMGAILALQQQVQALQAELNAVSSQIIKYKFANNRSSEPNNNNSMIMPASPSSSPPPPHHHHHHHHHLLSPPAVVSVAVPPPSSSPASPPQPPSSPPLLLPISDRQQQPSSASTMQLQASASSNVYSHSSTDHDYTSISNGHHNVSFFG